MIFLESWVCGTWSKMVLMNWSSTSCLFVSLLVWANDLVLRPEFCCLAWGRWYHLSIVWISSIISLLVKPRIQTGPIGGCRFSQHIDWYIRVTKNPFKENLYIVQRHSFHYIYHPLVKSRIFSTWGDITFLTFSSPKHIAASIAQTAEKWSRLPVMRWQALVLLVYERVAFAEVPPVTSIIHSRWIKSQNIEPLGFQWKRGLKKGGTVIIRICQGRSHSKEQWPSHDDCNFVGWRFALTVTGGWHELYWNLSPHRQRLRYIVKGNFLAKMAWHVRSWYIWIIFLWFGSALKLLPNNCRCFFPAADNGFLRFLSFIRINFKFIARGQGEEVWFGEFDVKFIFSLPLMELVTWVVVSLVCLLESWKNNEELQRPTRSNKITSKQKTSKIR